MKNLFKLYVLFLKDSELVSGETIPIDGTKSRAHNSKKGNFSQKKIDKHLEYIEAKTQQYLDALESNDTQDNPAKIQNIQQKIARDKFFDFLRNHQMLVRKTKLYHITTDSKHGFYKSKDLDITLPNKPS